MQEFIRKSLGEAQVALQNLMEHQQNLAHIEKAATLLIDCFERGGHVFSCGNGGSMCDAMHFTEELSGRFRKNRRALGAIAISDGPHITCTANDFGYEEIYARFIEGNARKGDLLLAISTSGKSPNIVRAVATAKALGVTTICLTGSRESPLTPLCDAEINTVCGAYSDRVQELHIKVIHILIELVERKLFPDNYL